MQYGTDSPEVIWAIVNWLMRPTAPGQTRKLTGIPCSLGSDTGIVRSENQDRVVAVRYRDQRGRPFLLVALADGMGGMRHGAQCASLALGGLIGYLVDPEADRFAPREKLLHAAAKANDLVYDIYEGGGGTTLVAALISDTGEACWLSAGDSRVYQQADKTVKQLSTDDTLAGQLGGRGEALDGHLLQFVGMGAGLEPHVQRLDTSDGGSIALTSDGVHFLDKSVWFAQVFNHAADGFQAVRRLIEVAKWCGGPDNASAAVLTIGAALGRSLSEATSYLEIHDPFAELALMTPYARAGNVQDEVPAPPPRAIPAQAEEAPPGDHLQTAARPRYPKRPKKKKKPGSSADISNTSDTENEVQIDLLGKDSE